jgi:hypothetical protein
LHAMRRRPCSQIWLPPHSLQKARRRPCSQIWLPPQSLHAVWRRPCSQIVCLSERRPSFELKVPFFVMLKTRPSTRVRLLVFCVVRAIFYQPSRDRREISYKADLALGALEDGQQVQCGWRDSDQTAVSYEIEHVQPSSCPYLENQNNIFVVTRHTKRRPIQTCGPPPGWCGPASTAPALPLGPVLWARSSRISTR